MPVTVGASIMELNLKVRHRQDAERNLGSSSLNECSLLSCHEVGFPDAVSSVAVTVFLATCRQ